MVEIRTAEEMSGAFSFLPKNAKNYVDEGFAWIQENPSRAAALSAVGGFAIGLIGVGRIYSAGRTLRTMPIVSQLVLGALVKGLVGTKGAEDRPALH